MIHTCFLSASKRIILSPPAVSFCIIFIMKVFVEHFSDFKALGSDLTMAEAITFEIPFSFLLDLYQDVTRK